LPLKRNQQPQKIKLKVIHQRRKSKSLNRPLASQKLHLLFQIKMQLKLLSKMFKPKIKLQMMIFHNIHPNKFNKHKPKQNRKQWHKFKKMKNNKLLLLNSQLPMIQKRRKRKHKKLKWQLLWQQCNKQKRRQLLMRRKPQLNH
jgi:hypothetical protein